MVECCILPGNNHGICMRWHVDKCTPSCASSYGRHAKTGCRVLIARHDRIRRSASPVTFCAESKEIFHRRTALLIQAYAVSAQHAFQSYSPLSVPSIRNIVSRIQTKPPRSRKPAPNRRGAAKSVPNTFHNMCTYVRG